MSNNTNERLNYVFPNNNDYAAITTELTFILETNLKKCPAFTVSLLTTLILKTQKINQLNKTGEIKYFETSLGALAKSSGKHKTTIQRAVQWLEANNWLEVEKRGGSASSYYKLNVGRISDAILQHQYLRTQ